jgi:gamma-glutamylcyclotransferase (GGCT)/AIG2-like uncharacterized protein YtfP
MNETNSWWQQESAYFLNETLAFINSSRTRDEAIDQCGELCKALNKTWNAFFQYRKRHHKLNDKELENDAKGKRTDNQSFQWLMLQGFSDQQALSFCQRDAVQAFAEFMPQIMNHDTLLKDQYDPFNITEEVRKRASDEHRQLSNAFGRFSQSPSDHSLKEALLKKTAQLIYVVRSNIAHSEKTPQGPDLDKSERDRLVSEVTAKVIDELFDIFFDAPSKRLAVYGTLAPDGPNASQLASLEGEWHEGTVQGVVENRNGFVDFKWSTAAQFIAVRILSAEGLSERFARLDRFEGPRYQRVLVPVTIDGTLTVCNIYQGKKR